MINIAVLAGGYTSEREISIKSGTEVFNNLDRLLFNPYFVEVNKDALFCLIDSHRYKVDMNDFSIIVSSNKIKFDYAFIVLHGSPGEDGKIQAYLDLINIPYSASGVFASLITYNKLACKKMLINNNISMAKSVVITKGQDFLIDEIINYLGLPCFVKPNTSGSSFGVTKVYEKNKFVDAVNEAYKEDDTVLIEEFIEGIEVSCGILKTKSQEMIFGITEIDTKNDFFDTEAKYDPSLTNEITPARISEIAANKVKINTSNIYTALNCKGIVRIDYIIKDNIPYFLEVNSIPGMSASSIIPKQIRYQNKSIKEILTLVVEAELNT